MMGGSSQPTLPHDYRPSSSAPTLPNLGPWASLFSSSSSHVSFCCCCWEGLSTSTSATTLSLGKRKRKWRRTNAR